MYPVNIEWWIFHFRGYEGHWALITLIFGYFYQRKRSLKAGYELHWFNSAWGYSILSGFFFARLFHFLFWDQKNFLQNPILFFSSSGGFAILGGTIGTAIGAYLYCHFTKKDFLYWCDSLMLPLAIGLCISRIACFLNGDGYGLPTSSFLGITFSENSDAWMAEWRYLNQFYANQKDPLAVISQIFKDYVNLADIPLPDSLSSLRQLGIENLAQLSQFYPPTATGNYKVELEKLGLLPFPVIYPRVHPTQIYEIFILSIFTIILKVIETKSWSHKKLFFIFWMFYGTNRFIIEFFRGDRNLLLGNFTNAQVISLVLVIGSVLALFLNPPNEDIKQI
jgi:prolipoprotein diacylglyceryltransferase